MATAPTTPPGLAGKASQAPLPPPIVGDLLPDFQLQDQSMRVSVLSTQALGHPVVLLLTPDPGAPAAAKLLRTFAEVWEELGERVHFFCITAVPPEVNAKARSLANLPFALLSDPQGQVAGGLGYPWRRQADPFAAPQCLLLITDANRRIRLIDPAAADPLAQVRAYLAAQPHRQARLFQGPLAPAIYVSDVLEPELCARLIALHATENEPSGVLRDVAGGGRNIEDSQVKNRRDHYLKEPGLVATVKLRFLRRLLPEIAKATFYRVTAFEEFKVVRYDAESGGFFKPHRDNNTLSGAHRRFAVTLNLNAEDYDGGELTFPEYGPDLFKPASGDAVAFSCSLLHEALPVARGQRYVLLAFLFGEDAKRVRAPVRR
ncbi:2OG-Fe(II) oxygenase [Algihabitans albus]|uniref:2OG-Fe(II) oxygenase n=1 Tax=Algihabitans albus TaxID=2164067 RepID=UPI000E5CC00B|nr:2OG-Fe(II) oxygenase [Algihabitans albus]